MDNFWWSGLIGGLLLLWVGSLVMVRWWTRRRLLQTLTQTGLEPAEFHLLVDDPQPQDLRAQEIIRAYRRRYWLKLWPDTEIGVKIINDLAQELIQAIAGVYYPDADRPELKASLADLVGLYNRVGVRLQSWLDTLPVRPFKDLELETVFRYHELYQKVKTHPGYRFLKRHHLDKVGRWAWMVKNFANPWYWGRQAAYTGGKEVLGRLFLARVPVIVGEEALRVYSRRPLNSRAWGRYQIAVQEMINLSLENGALRPEAANFILDFILQARGLEDQEKLTLLGFLADPQVCPTPAPDSLESSDRDQIYRWLKQLAAAGGAGGKRDQRLAAGRNRGDR